VAVRSAIGASRGRIVRQMLVEALVLSLAAGIVGISIAQGTLQAVAVVAPVDLPRFDEVAVDNRILFFALAVSVLATMLVGLLPAWQSASADPQDAMRSSRTATAGRAAGRVRAALVGVQVALSAVCLIAAGLLLHSFVRLLNVDPGFRAERIVTAELTFSPARYPNQQARTAFLDAVFERLAAAPSITGSGVTNGLPLTAQGGNGPLFVDGVNVPIWERPVADIRGVDAAFFETLGIPRISGGVFDRRERDRLVVVLSEVLAARMWPGTNPIGRRVRIGLPNAPEAEVIGVVGDVHNTTLEGRAFPAVYMPYWQRSRTQWTLIVKTAAGAETGYAGVRAAIRAVDPEMPVPSLKTMDDVVMASVAPRQFQMRLVVLFGVVALFLASLGIYGVVSYSVAQRSSEIGLRIALGASICTIATTVLRQGMLPVIVGLAVGLLTSVGVGRALRAMLFGVSPADATTLVIATFVLLVVGLLACYIPARRAARVDPLVALRYE
jgi:putative ABC transport system permease protein